MVGAGQFNNLNSTHPDQFNAIRSRGSSHSAHSGGARALAMKPVKYETKSTTTVRGRGSRTITKWEQDGWEIVDQTAGRLSSTPAFRRPRPAINRAKVLGIGAVVVLAAVALGVGALLEGGGDHEEPASATHNETPAKSPSASQGESTPVTVDQLLDKLNSAGLGGIKPGDRFKFTGELFESDA